MADYSSVEWSLQDSGCCLSRVNTYVRPLKGAIGPKQTRVVATQFIRYVNEKSLELETLNVSKDVPMGDNFVIHELIQISQSGTDENPSLFVQCKLLVKFKGSTWGMKGMIEKKTVEGAKVSFQLFAEKTQARTKEHLSNERPVAVRKPGGDEEEKEKKKKLVSAKKPKKLIKV